MKRLLIEPRMDWQERVESVGMQYHTIDGDPYWDESVCYRFTSKEVDELDVASAELHDMCIKAAEHVISGNLFSRLHIPEPVIPLIIRSWEADEPSVYGRFDLAYDGESPPKLLEYNADTPTALLEAAVVQWFWLQDCFPRADQFNSIHEKLVAFWENWPYLQRDLFYFACAAHSAEDLGNIEYLRDTAMQGGFETRQLFMEEIGWDDAGGRFVDLQCEPIRLLFKLYPWEWLTAEEFGAFLHKAPLRVIEPAWKMLLSTKGILPVLWELFPGHPNLLEATFEEKPLAGDYVRKPLLSREGENVVVHRNGGWEGTPGTYGAEGFIYQRYAALPDFDGNFPVVGSWIIGGEPAGIGIREDRSRITTNASRFVPHFFEEE